MCGSEVDSSAFEYFSTSYFQILHNILRQHQTEADAACSIPSNSSSSSSSLPSPSPLLRGSSSPRRVIPLHDREERLPDLHLPSQHPQNVFSSQINRSYNGKDSSGYSHHAETNKAVQIHDEHDEREINKKNTSMHNITYHPPSQFIPLTRSPPSPPNPATRRLSLTAPPPIPFSQTAQEDEEEGMDRNFLSAFPLPLSSSSLKNAEALQLIPYSSSALLATSSLPRPASPGEEKRNNKKKNVAAVEESEESAIVPSYPLHFSLPLRTHSTTIMHRGNTAAVVLFQQQKFHSSGNVLDEGAGEGEGLETNPASPIMTFHGGSSYEFVGQPAKKDAERDQNLMANSAATMAMLLDQNPFLAPDRSTARVETANNIPEGLLVTGYYNRFFKEIRSLGSGAFGQVFLCQHVIDDLDLGTYAIKKVPVGNDRNWLHSTVREVKIRERLNHPNLVEYKHCWLELHQSNEMCPRVPWFFVLMEFCNGGDVEGLIWNAHDGTARAPLSDDVIWKLLADTLFGLQHLHHAGILHRDLKPSNIMLHVDLDRYTGRKTCKALLADFGTAARREELSLDSRKGFTGTAEFTAPEMLRRDTASGKLVHDYSSKADIWSVGVQLFALCFNALPYPSSTNEDDGSLQSLHERILNHTTLLHLIPPQAAGGRQRSADLIALILAMTHKDSALRPSVDDLLSHPKLQSRLGDVERMMNASEELANVVEANRRPECDIKELFRRKMREKQLLKQQGKN
eukprot:GDKK01020663.1.p1 GENE.GDKK01020663.1~~GDKK01020663.1.p1  ORF type:complete len:850 (-),score=186.22 GDKK01020663.1:48-2270(-)